MEKKLTELKKEYSKLLKEALNFEDLKDIKSKYINKNETLIEINSKFREFSNDDKKKFGKLVSDYKNEFNIAFNNSRERIDLKKINDSINIPLIDPELFIDSFPIGTKHPLERMKNMIFDFFTKYGFDFSDAPIIESEKYNFDRLNIPQNHPARVMQDTFFLDDNKILRTHATNSTSRNIESLDNFEKRMFTIGKVFRNDDDDKTHYHQFHQIDVFDIGSKSNLSKLVKIIKEFLKEIFSDEIEIRFRTSYFPFTEPSLEVDVKSKKLSSSGWIEVLGCGMIHENVINHASKKYQSCKGYAIGIGLERLAMIKWGIDDIRYFYDSDIDFLKKSEEAF